MSVRRIWLAAAAAMCLAAIGHLGCAESSGNTKDDDDDDNKAKAAYQEPKYEDQNGLTITAQNIKMDDDRLVFELMFWNKTDKTMVVNRDKLMVKLPDGAEKSRYEGMMTGFGMSEAAHTIPPKGNHDVHVQFVVGKAPPTATLELKGVLLDGSEVQFPDYTVSKK